MSLRERCTQMVEQLRLGGSPEDLVAFVTAEIGRAHENQFDITYPLCLYFLSEKDRDEFSAYVADGKSMTARKVP